MISLASQYRPKTLQEIVGQNITKKILLKQVATGNIKNIYLFTGKTGIGKTTFSRALAYEINGGIGEPIEIDAASNSGVDNVRELIGSANERSLTGKYKIITIDECHVFSSAAWQALLKYFEEPSPYTIFILCTTELQKVPATILNRVQQFNLVPLKSEEIKERLKYICENERLQYTEDALDLISKLAEGSMRDAICKLERCIGYDNFIDSNCVSAALGESTYQILFRLVNNIIDGEEASIITTIEECSDNGIDLKVLMDRFLNLCLDLAKFTIFKSYDVLRIPATFNAEIDNATNLENAKNYYSKLVDKILDIRFAIKQETSVKDTCEIMLLQAARCRR